MVQFQLQFQNLVLEDMKTINHRSEEQVAITFDKGHVTRPFLHYFPQSRTTIHIKGAFLLSLPLCEIPKQGGTSEDNSKLKSVLNNLDLECLPLDHDSFLTQLHFCSTSDLLMIAPTLKPRTKKSKIFLKASLLMWSMEDYFSRALITSAPLLTKDHFQDIERFLYNIMTGMYRNVDGIPNTDIAFLNEMLQTWFNIYDDLKRNVTGFEKLNKAFLTELLNWIRSYRICALHMGVAWEPSNQPYTMQKWMGGMRVIIELIQLLTSTFLDERIRDHVLLTLLMESVDLVCNLVRDVISINGTSEMRRNSLAGEVRKGGISLEEVLEKYVVIVNNEIMNIQKLARALVLEFSGDETVVKYVKNTLLFLDGITRFILGQESCGKCERKVMKVVKIGKTNI